MASSKSQHFVPQFLLRHFSSNKKSISVFNFKKNIYIPAASIRKQCQRSRFYDNGGTVEKSLAVVEGETASLFREIINTGEPPPQNSEHHVLLLFFIILQKSRTVQAAEEYDDYIDKWFKQVYGPTLLQKTNGDVDFNKFKIVSTHAVGASMQHVVDSYPLALDLEIVLLKNQTDIGFVISDNPVVYYNSFLEERRYASNTGLQSVGLLIFLPLSPIFTIMFFDSGVYGIGRRRRRTINIQSNEDVKQLNGLQILSANENVYFNNCKTDHADIVSTQASVSEYFRTRTTNIHVQKEVPEKPNQTKELVGFYKEDIRCQLSLSFLKIIKRAQKVKDDCMMRIAVRDEMLLEEFARFREQVKKDIYKPGEFLSFYIKESKLRRKHLDKLIPSLKAT